MAVSPLMLLFPLVYLLLECIALKDSRLRLITDRDYGHGVSGKKFFFSPGNGCRMCRGNYPSSNDGEGGSLKGEGEECLLKKGDMET